MGRTPDERWTSFSVAKSVTSTLIGAAIAGRCKTSAVWMTRSPATFRN